MDRDPPTAAKIAARRWRPQWLRRRSGRPRSGGRPSSAPPRGALLESALSRYGLAAALFACAFAVEIVFHRQVQPVIYQIFYPTAFLTAWLAGIGPAVFHLLLALAGIWWIDTAIDGSPPALDPVILLRMGFFAAFNVLAAWLIWRGRRAENALKKSEERLRVFGALIENSSDFIGIADPDGKPVYVNPAGRRMVGLAPDHPIERTTIPEYYPLDVRAFAADVIVKSMIERGNWSGETYFRNWRTQQAIPVSDEHFMIREPLTGRVLGMGTITRDISERKRLEEALRRSEADLKRAQAVAQLGSWRLDLRSAELVWSEQTYRLFGLPVGATVTYSDFLAVVHPDDRAYVEGEWKAALGGTPHDVEHRIVVGGDVRWIHARAELECDRNGHPVRAAGTVQDVTERKTAELQMRTIAEKERFRAALQAASTAMIIVDRGGRITYINDEAESLFGWSRRELVGKTVEALVPERYRAAHPEKREGFFHEHVAKRMMDGRELVAARKDGTEVHVEIGLARVEESGEEFAVVSIIDISERKSTEDALLESEQRFRLLITSVRDYAIFMVDLQGLVTVWNEGAERILGYKADEILGRSFHLFGLPEDEPKIESELRGALEKGSLEVERWRVRKDGSRFWASVVTTPIFAPGGKHLGFGKVIRDLTDRRKAEQEITESHAQLRQSVLELEGFAYTISHDLRSPLRAIEGYSHFLTQRLSALADPESREMLRRIGQAAARLDRLIRDLLSYSAIARQSVEFEPVDVGDIIAHVADHYPEVAKARLRIKAPLGRVMAQPSLMIQIFSNLLTNAVKFMPPDRAPEVDVWSERTERGTSIVFVQDNGIGMPQDAWERVFKPFERLHPAGRYEGTGIGLAIVKKAVERMDGRIVFFSEPGKGSRFAVELRQA